MAYAVEYDAEALDDLDEVGRFWANRILDAIEKHLPREPARASRRKKLLEGVQPPWQQIGPVWQLSVGEYRVFYDVIEGERLVVVRAVRHKPPHKETDDVL